MNLIQKISILILASLLLPFSTLNAQSQGEISISASVSSCTASLIIKPEKRMPREGNFAEKYLVVFYDQLYQEIFRIDNLETNNNGYSSIDLCSREISTTPGIYSIYIKSESHLGKLFSNVQGFFNYSTEFNLARNENEYLLAGDAINHNYINGLDVNKVINRLYTNEPRYDFNKDGIVNSLDLSNQIYNLHKRGDLIL